MNDGGVLETNADLTAHWRAIAEEARTENERLRQALDELLAHYRDGTDWAGRDIMLAASNNDGDWQMVHCDALMAAVRAAREALGETDGE